MHEHACCMAPLERDIGSEDATDDNDTWYLELPLGDDDGPGEVASSGFAGLLGLACEATWMRYEQKLTLQLGCTKMTVRTKQ